MIFSECAVITDHSDRELIKHGSVSFPIACYRDIMPPKRFIWHWHDELEVGIIASGTLRFRSGGYCGEIKAGDGYFVNAGILHEGLPVENSPCELHAIIFHPRLIAGNVESIFWQKYIQPLISDVSCRGLLLDKNIPWNRDVLEAAKNTWQACEKEEPGYEFLIREHLSRLTFLMEANRQKTQRKVSPKVIRTSERTKAMLHYIQEHLSDELKISDIAASAAISESECLRCFHNLIGEAPIQYVKRLRIERASELLKSTDLKVEDIAMQCGFQDMSYFAKVFKTFKNCTPSQFRDAE